IFGLRNLMMTMEYLFKIKGKFLIEIGDTSRFAARFFKELFKSYGEWEEFLRQCFWVGYKTLALVAATAFIMGMVLTIQTRPTLVEFGAQALLPAMISVSLVR